MVETRGFDETTLSDAQALLRRRFSIEVAHRAEKFLLNPLRVKCSSVGDISYKDGMPMAFQAAILRRFYIGQDEFLGVVGSSLCKAETAKLRYVIAVSERTESCRGGSCMTFGNTAIKASQDLVLAQGGSLGPKSCSEISFAVLRWGGGLQLATGNRMPRFITNVLDKISQLRLGQIHPKITIENKIDMEAFDDFWHNYLSENNGLTLSRSALELQWVFGNEMKSGNVRVLTYKENCKIVGYVAIKERENSKGTRWFVADWIAIGNNETVLSALLESAKIHLITQTAAIVLESIGYPMFIQRVIKKVLPFKRPIKGNVFTYFIHDKDVARRFEEVKSKSWFFGGFDGDRCL